MSRISTELLFEAGKKVSAALGMCPSFGSKSGFRSQFPNKDPIFNCYMMIAFDNYVCSDSGIIYPLWKGDIVVEDNEVLLKELAKELKATLFIYRESTVHNRTFNGHLFPYSDFKAQITSRGEVSYGD